MLRNSLSFLGIVTPKWLPLPLQNDDAALIVIHDARSSFPEEGWKYLTSMNEFFYWQSWGFLEDEPTGLCKQEKLAVQLLLVNLGVPLQRIIWIPDDSGCLQQSSGLRSSMFISYPPYACFFCAPNNLGLLDNATWGLVLLMNSLNWGLKELPLEEIWQCRGGPLGIPCHNL